MRVFVFLMVLVCLAVSQMPLTGQAQKDYTAEAKWARGIAEDFWRATQFSEAGVQVQNCLGLLSPEFAKPFEFFKGSIFGWQTARIDSELVAPDGSEVVFEGLLRQEEPRWRWDEDAPWWSPDGPRHKKFTFKMRVAREAGGGKWSIRYLELKEPE